MDSMNISSKRKILNVFMVIIFTLFVAPNVFAENTTQEKKNADKKTSVSIFQEKIIKSTPEYISKPIISSVDFLEKWRGEQSSVFTEKKNELKSEIDIQAQKSADAEVLKEVDDTKALEENTKENKIGKEFTSVISTPFKHVKLFFFASLATILGNKFLFYGVLIVTFLVLIKLIWNKIFG